MRSYLRRLLAPAILLAATSAATAGNYGPGASDTEIKIGQTMAYSGPASSLSSMGKTQSAYFARLNKQGGINGRRVTLLSLDDAYSPPRTVEQTRKLVEQDGVLFMYGSAGTPTNLSVKKYLLSKGVPQLLIISGGNWNDPKNFPMTTAITHTYDMEGRIYAKYLQRNRPGATVAVLYQNDDYGREHLRGFKDELGAGGARAIVAEGTYESTDASIDGVIANLAASKADVLLNISQGKFAAQAIRRVHERGWKPDHLLVFGASPAVMMLDEASRPMAAGVISATFYKNPADPALAADQDVRDYLAFLAEWAPDVSPRDPLGVNGYIAAATLTHVLRQSGDDLTRANVVRQATNIDRLAVPMLLSGVTITVQPDNYAAFHTSRLQKFDGVRWQVLPDAISAD